MMKAQSILGALIPFLVTANAASRDADVKSLRLSGAELQNLADMVKSHGLADRLAADQSINCTVSYTLALSTGGPPYTIALTSLDLSGCVFTGA